MTEKNMVRALKKSFMRWLRDDSGVTAIIFVLCLPAILAAGGVAVDLAQAYNAKVRLGNALDKAALAAGSTSGTDAEIVQMVENFFHANYPDEKVGTVSDVTVSLNGNIVNVKATAHVKTLLMSAFGYDSIDVSGESEVLRELAGVEVTLVLDVTGSMAGAKITALKNAVCSASSSSSCKTSSFINILYSEINDTQYLKIGLVPFAQSVNVGPYGLGKDAAGHTYDSVFVNYPSSDDYVSPVSKIKYGTGSTDWGGCILERNYPKDTTDDASPNWGMYRVPKICSKYKSNGSCKTWTNTDPNTGCPTAPIVPMTNDLPTLRKAIYNLQANGNTVGNVGMVWGWRVISPTFPFKEGAAYNDRNWSKTVIMMTDGDNTYGYYDAYGYNSSVDVGDMNSRFLTVCTNMKQKGITVYTIAFDDGGGIANSTKTMLQSCASGTDKYYNASRDNIGAAFEAIAHHLSPAAHYEVMCADCVMRKILNTVKFEVMVKK